MVSRSQCYTGGRSGVDRAGLVSLISDHLSPFLAVDLALQYSGLFRDELDNFITIARAELDTTMENFVKVEEAIRLRAPIGTCVTPCAD